METNSNTPSKAKQSDDIENESDTYLSLNGDSKESPNMSSPESCLKPESGKMIKNKKDLVILTVLCLVLFHGFFSFSMIAPFFPEVAANKGVSTTVDGLVFAIHPLVVFLLSPLVGKWISKPGRTRPFILIGTTLIGSGNIAFAFVYKAHSMYLFIVLSFIARIIIAVGTSLANTAGLAFLTEKFQSHLSTVFGITELFVGIGFMSGPSVGSVLFDYGGFWLPFVVVGGLNFSNLICLWFFLPKHIAVPKPTNAEAELSNSDVDAAGEKKITIWRSLKIPAVWMVCLSIHTIGFFLTYIQPTFTGHLDDITNNTISMSRKGLVFFLCPGIYAISAPVLGIFIDQYFNARNLIIGGHFLVALSYIFMGPSPLFKSFLKKGLTVTSIAYGFLGIAQCPIMVPVIADLQSAIVDAGYPAGQRTSSIVSGLFTSAINLGQMNGPIFGGLFREYMSFPWEATIMAFFVFFEGIALLLFTMYQRGTWNICCERTEEYPVEIVEGKRNVTYDSNGDEVEIR